MAAPKGHKKYGGGGSRKGKPNKLTKSAKEAFQFAFDKLGGADGLAQWAKTNKDDFYKLYARLIPIDISTGGEKITGIEVVIKK